MTDKNDTNRVRGWGILELMGHRSHAGFIVEEERFGTVMARIDIPRADGSMATKHYGGASIYGISWTDEDTARAYAAEQTQDPIIPWRMQQQALPAHEQDAEVITFGEDSMDDDYCDQEQDDEEKPF
jgi:hypothetical protein